MTFSEPDGLQALKDSVNFKLGRMRLDNLLFSVDSIGKAAVRVCNCDCKVNLTIPSILKPNDTDLCNRGNAQQFVKHFPHEK